MALDESEELELRSPETIMAHSQRRADAQAGDEINKAHNDTSRYCTCLQILRRESARSFAKSSSWQCLCRAVWPVRLAGQS